VCVLYIAPARLPSDSRESAKSRARSVSPWSDQYSSIFSLHYICCPRISPRATIHTYYVLSSYLVSYIATLSIITIHRQPIQESIPLLALYFVSPRSYSAQVSAPLPGGHLYRPTSTANPAYTHPAIYRFTTLNWPSDPPSLGFNRLLSNHDNVNRSWFQSSPNSTGSCVHTPQLY
jgi:hypothetical protein